MTRKSLLALTWLAASALIAPQALASDAVVLREAPPDDSAVWQSLWAAMTFAVP